MAEEEPEEMDAEAEADSELMAEPPKGTWIKQFVILAILVLIGQGAVSYVLVTRQVRPKLMSMEEGDETMKTAKIEERILVDIEEPLLHHFAEMILNPADEQAIRYLNTLVSIELENQETMDLLIADDVLAIKMEDLIRQTLIQTRYIDLDEYSERDALKEKLKTVLNGSELLQTGQVMAVYFKRFILQ
ncbi:MAG: flagellar basal body-associated FliL family protein [SAR324 cluster bacterium]|nr:flagellar basal body-associated FliL family protein [SAR324 cluster bacterium]